MKQIIKGSFPVVPFQSCLNTFAVVVTKNILKTSREQNPTLVQFLNLSLWGTSSVWANLLPTIISKSIWDPASPVTPVLDLQLNIASELLLHSEG